MMPEQPPPPNGPDQAERAPTQAYGPYRTPEPASPPKRAGVLGTLAAGVGALLLKFKSLLFVLKALPFLKFGFSGLSMLVYLWVGAMRWGWRFGIGLTLLILVHELGHGYAIRKNGLQAGWPVFIPFFGAMISMKGDQRLSPDVDAEISFGGPLWGTIASFIVLCMYFVTDSPFWLTLGYAGLFMNMFNLLPVRPLDGGAIVETFSRKAWVLGAVGLVALLLATPASPALIFVLLALPRAFARSRAPINQADTATRKRWQFNYFALLAFMGAGMYFTNRLLHAMPGAPS